MTAGELMERLRDAPPDTPVIICYDSGFAYTSAKSCGIEVQGDYHPHRPWNDDGSANRVDVFYISTEEKGSSRD